MHSKVEAPTIKRAALLYSSAFFELEHAGLNEGDYISAGFLPPSGSDSEDASESESSQDAEDRDTNDRYKALSCFAL